MPDQTTTRGAGELLTPSALAERWHLAPHTLANHRSRGIGCRYLKLGSRVLYRLADVEAHEQANDVETYGAAA